jgi:DNA-binding NarL/FixJ family response regulator
MIGSSRDELLDTYLPRLAREPDFDLQGGPVTDPARIASSLKRQQPKVLLLDKALLDRLDARSLRVVRERSAGVRVLLLWDEDRGDLVGDVLRNHFHGFLLTNCRPDMCLKAIRAVARGEIWLPRTSLAKALTELQRWPELGDTRLKDDAAAYTDTSEALTPRETQIVGLVRRGWTNKQIARQLGIMEDTVKKHLQSIFTKLGVRRRTLVVLGQIAGEIQPHEPRCASSPQPHSRRS